MDTNNNYIIDTELNNFDFTPSPLNTSCSGGTITNISFIASEENNLTTAYVVTIKELRNCSGFDDISIEQAEVIIQALSQLSALSYQILINE